MKVVFGHHAEHLQVLHGNLFVAHLACHTHAFEHFCEDKSRHPPNRVRGDGCAGHGCSAYTAETVTLNYALKPLPLQIPGYRQSRFR